MFGWFLICWLLV
uniref:Uncharacterized protein n=1 Tax=Arundo donax TaxID=35708 RepID=A0A0A9GYR4_ARUDO